MGVREICEYALQREHEGRRFFEENAARAEVAHCGHSEAAPAELDRG